MEIGKNNMGMVDILCHTKKIMYSIHFVKLLNYLIVVILVFVTKNLFV